MLASAPAFIRRSFRALAAAMALAGGSAIAQQVEIDVESSADAKFTNLGGAGALRSGRDVNGDGIDDLLIEANNVNFVLFGSRTLASTSTADVTVNGTQVVRAGASIALGDVNGDGIADVLSGSGTFGGAGYTGAAFVLTRTATLPRPGTLNFPADADLVFGIGGSSQLGGALASGGDLDGDGFEDLAIADPNGNGGAGQVFVYYGPITSTAGLAANATFTADDTSEHLGSFVAVVRNMDGDTAASDELVIGNGAPCQSGSCASKVYLVLGGPRLSGSLVVTATANVTIDASPPILLSQSAGEGGPIVASGDLNGDGLGDLILTDANAPNRAAHVFFGSSALLGGGRVSRTLASSEVRVSGLPRYGYVNNRGQIFGVASGADFSGDGIDDLLIGAPYAAYVSNYAQYGAAFVLFGSTALAGDVPIGRAERRLVPPIGAAAAYYYNDRYLGAGVAFGRIRGGRSTDAIVASPGRDTVYVLFGADPVTPVADAGPDQSVECVGGGAFAALDGRFSHDANDNIVGFEWREGQTVLGTSAALTASFSRSPAPTHTATLRVTDRTGDVGTDTMQVTVADTKPPVIMLLTALYAVTTADPAGIARTDPQVVAITTSAAVAFDVCAGRVLLALATSLPPTIPVGVTQVTLQATDPGGNTATQALDVDVVFATSPTPTSTPTGGTLSAAAIQQVVFQGGTACAFAPGDALAALRSDALLAALAALLYGAARLRPRRR